MILTAKSVEIRDKNKNAAIHPLNVKRYAFLTTSSSAKTHKKS